MTHPMHPDDTPPADPPAQDPAPRQPRATGQPVLFWIRLALSVALVLVGCFGIVAGLAFLLIPPKPYDYMGFSKLFATVSFVVALIALTPGAISLYACLKRLRKGRA